MCYGADMDDQINKLEEQVAHLLRVTEELSEIVARQDDDITTLNRRVATLMQREAERELAEGGTVPLADPPPPHW